MHYAIKNYAKIKNSTTKDNISLNNSGFDHSFAKISEVLQNADITSGNMEFPIAPPFIQDGLIFNCPPEILPALKKAGFNLLNIANNHLMDQNYSGMRSTLNYLDNEKIKYIGVNHTQEKTRSGIILNPNGLRIGFISYTGLTNNGFPPRHSKLYLNFVYDIRKVITDIKNIRPKCDFLIMQVHTGKEYSIKPLKYDKKYFKLFINSGVDLIIGHHPHVLQPAEKIISKDNRECFIFYSLGNFIANQSRKININDSEYLSIKDSIIVKAYLSKYKNKINQVYKIIPIHTTNVIHIINKIQYREIQTVSIKNELKLLKNFKPKNSKEKKEIKEKIDFYQARTKAIKDVISSYSLPENIIFED